MSSLFFLISNKYLSTRLDIHTAHLCSRSRTVHTFYARWMHTGALCRQRCFRAVQQYALGGAHSEQNSLKQNMQVFKSSFGSAFLQIMHALSFSWNIFTLLFDYSMFELELRKRMWASRNALSTPSFHKYYFKKNCLVVITLELRALRFAERKINGDEEMQA